MKVNLENECLEVLGERFKKIAESNQKFIDTINSRKSNMITCGFSFSLKCQTESKPWALESTPNKIPVSTRLRNWKYDGEKLEEPEDIFNDKIDYTLERWENVQRLNKELHKVSCKFSDRLADKIENRRDMYKFLANITKISHAIENVIKLTVDMVDPLTKHETMMFKTLEEKFIDLDFTLDASIRVGDTFEYFDSSINFHDFKDWQLKRVQCQSNRTSNDDSKANYDATFFGFEGKPYVAITFNGCKKEATGFHGLVRKSGFEVWDLSSSNQTPCECIHDGIHSVLACRKNGKLTIISGSDSGVLLWHIGDTLSFGNLPIDTTNRSITVLVEAIRVDGSSILACGYSDGVIELWDINQMKIVKELNNARFNAINFIKFLDEDTLVSRSSNGLIDFWWIRTNKCVTSCAAFPNTLDNCCTAYVCEGKPFVVLPSSNNNMLLNLSTWDVSDNTMLKSKKTFEKVSSLRTIYSNDTPYLVLDNGACPEILNVSSLDQIAMLNSPNPSSSTSNPNGFTFNGSKPDGFSFNGSKSGGFTFNGSKPDGFTFNGSNSNNFTFNGSNPNGFTSNVFNPFKVDDVPYIPEIKSCYSETSHNRQSSRKSIHENSLSHNVYLWWINDVRKNVVGTARPMW